MAGLRTLDPYAVLGVSREATPLQVARAHRRLAKRHHPDLHEGATDAADAMRRINEAWWVLSNPIRRADYDRAHPFTHRRRAATGARRALRSSRLLLRRRAPGRPGAPRPPRRARLLERCVSPARFRRPHAAPTAARADALDVPRLGLGGTARRGADRSAPGRGNRDRPPHPLVSLAGARHQDPAKEQRADHQRDAGEEHHRPR